MDPILLVVLGAIVVIAVTAAARQAGVAAPLALVLVGVTVSFIPGAPGFMIEPELILAGVLPPLLYAAAVELPVMDFRRDFASIGALSVGLVILTSAGIGTLMYFLIDDMTIPTAIAIGAVLSPTDAVATQITKRLGAPPRVITVLEGEGLLNDATALVLLRSAVAASLVAVSVGEVIANFLWAVAGAIGIGLAVGYLSIFARRALSSPALTTAISFVVPFAALWPAEHFGASGLVAVVVAGLVSGQHAGRFLSPQDRFFERTNWHTVSMLLEGGIFLMMGLEVRTLVNDVHRTHDLLWQALAFGLLALVILLAIRAVYVLPLLLQMRVIAQRRAIRKPNLESRVHRIDAHLRATPSDQPISIGSDAIISRRLARLLHRNARTRIADTDYLLAKPMGKPEGGLLVFAGLRGVVTLAAAQSLPHSFPHRSFVVMLAFFVATGSLLLQGGTLPWFMRRLGLVGLDDNSDEAHVIHHLVEDAARDFLTDPDLLRPDGTPYDPEVLARVRRRTVPDVPDEEFDSPEELARATGFRELYSRTLSAQRNALLDLREVGSFDSRALEAALTSVDAEQISLELKPGEWLTSAD